MKIKTTVVLEKNIAAYEAGYRYIVNQGSSRSSKTISLSQLIIKYCMDKWVNKRITIIRKTFPALRESVMYDFFSLLRQYGIYAEVLHDKTNNYYYLKSNRVSFASVDDPQKVRGREHDIIWFNEANEIDHEDFKQVNMRTIDTLFFDYNPSDEYHWIYSDLLENSKRAGKVCYIHSTYKDNPFLSPDIRDVIEGYKGEDEEYWKVYGLGERATSPNTIYTHYRLIKTVPEVDEIFYGLDFGFNHICAVVKVGLKDMQYYVEELLFKTGLTPTDLVKELKVLIPNIKREIYCDSARPDLIEELKRAGFNVFPSNKAVLEGITFVKSQKMFITEESVNFLKQLRAYKWKTDKEGKVLDEPIKLQDDGPDSIRYSIFSHHKRYHSGKKPITELDIQRMEEEYENRGDF